MSDELTAEKLAQAAEAEELREADVPGPEDTAPGEPAEEVPALETAEAAEAAPLSEPAPDPETLQAEAYVVVSADSEETERARLKAVIEAVIYITDEPLALQQIAQAIARPIEEVKGILDELSADYARADRGLSIRELAGGYKMSTKPEHHEEIRAFVKNLKPPLKLSLAALETLAVIAYKQPVTAPEIMEIRGVQGAGVLKTLLDRKLVATAGRKNVVGKPILYKTTREFLVQFGLKDLSELPTLKEFEELGRFALTDAEADAAPPSEPAVHEPGHLPVTHAQDPESAPIEAPDDAEPPAEEPPSPEPPVEEPPSPEPPIEDPRPDPEPVEEPPPPPDQPEPPQKVETDESDA